MNVVECDVPSGSLLSREVIEHAHFRDSYRAPLSRGELGIVDVFLGIFAHHPLWMKLLLIVRNKVASIAGLNAPTASDILHTEIKDRYVVGDKIGASCGANCRASLTSARAPSLEVVEGDRSYGIAASPSKT